MHRDEGIGGDTGAVDGPRLAEVEAELEQQVSALTGGLGYSNYQGMERAKQKIMAETAARECSVCFLENGEHEDWCKGQRQR